MLYPVIAGALSLFGLLYFAVVLIGNCLVYSERNPTRYSTLGRKDCYEILKWTYFWPLLAMYWIPKLLWDKTRPWVWGGVTHFFGGYAEAYRYFKTGK